MKFSDLVGVFFCTLLFPAFAFSQDYVWHPRTSLSLSLNYSQIRDENVGPMVFSGIGLGGSLERRVENDFYYHLIEASGCLQAPKSSSEKTNASLSGSLGLKYAFLLKRAFGSDYVNIGLFGQLSVKDAFYRNYKGNNLFWSNFAGLGGVIEFERPLSENLAIASRFEISLAGIATRPSQTGRSSQKNTIGNVISSNLENGDFAMPGNYLNPSLQFALLCAQPSFVRSISYKYIHYEVKTAVSRQYWENCHALIFTFSLGKSGRG